MKRITLKTINRKYIVTVNGTEYTFPTMMNALVFINATRKEVA